MNVITSRASRVCAFAAGLVMLASSAAADDAAAAITVIDRETGELRAPTAEEAAKYRNDASKSSAPGGETLIITRRADGSESVRLKGQFTTYITVQRAEDGSWQETCTADHDHAVVHGVKSTQRAEQ